MLRSKKVKEPRTPSDENVESKPPSDRAKSTGSFNQLGGFYVNGKPLSYKLRVQIIQLATMGMRACDISKYLKVSHGCVSKIITRYKETGSVNPGFIGGSKPKVATPEVVAKVAEYRTRFPGIFGWEIRGKLIDDKVCEEKNIPSISSINRIVRTLENRDPEFKDLDICLPGQGIPPVMEASFGTPVLAPNISIEHQFQNPKCQHPQLAEDFTTPKSSVERLSAMNSSRPPVVQASSSQPASLTASHDAEVANPPCKYSNSNPAAFEGSTVSSSQQTLPDKPCHDSSSNSSFEGSWSASTQDSGIWSDMSDLISSYPHSGPSYHLSSGSKSCLPTPSLPRRRTKRQLVPQPSSAPASQDAPRKRARKQTGLEDSDTPTSDHSSKRALSKKGYKSPLLGGLKSEIDTSYLCRATCSQPLPSTHYSTMQLSGTPSLDNAGYSPPRDPRLRLSSPRVTYGFDGSSLLCPYSGLETHASHELPWSQDGHGELYTTPSPPSFHTELDFSANNSNFSQSSPNKMSTPSSRLSDPTQPSAPVHPAYFSDNSPWHAQLSGTPPKPIPLDSPFHSQQTVSPTSCMIPQPARPAYPSPDSTSPLTTPFYPPPVLSASLYQFPTPVSERGLVKLSTVASQPIRSDLVSSSHSLHTAMPSGMEGLAQAEHSRNQHMPTCSLFSTPHLHSSNPSATGLSELTTLTSCSYSSLAHSSGGIQKGASTDNYFLPDTSSLASPFPPILEDPAFQPAHSF